MVSRKIVDDLAVKALNDDEIFSCEVMETRDYIDEYLSISNIEEKKD